MSEYQQFCESLKAHCEGGLRRGKGGRMLYGCGNYDRVRKIVVSSRHLIDGYPRASLRPLDAIVAGQVHGQTLSDFGYTDACAVIAEAGETRLNEDHINIFERSHYAAMHLYRWTHAARGVKVVVYHWAKTILFMEAYSFLAEELLDEKGNWI